MSKATHSDSKARNEGPPLHKLSPAHSSHPRTTHPQPTNSSLRQTHLLDNMPKNKGKVRTVSDTRRGCPAMLHDAMTPCTTPRPRSRIAMAQHLSRYNIRIVPNTDERNRVVRTGVGVRTRTTTRSASSSSRRKVKNTHKSSRCSETVV
jgi:hypothetical protein